MDGHTSCHSIVPTMHTHSMVKTKTKPSFLRLKQSLVSLGNWEHVPLWNVRIYTNLAIFSFPMHYIYVKISVIST